MTPTLSPAATVWLQPLDSVTCFKLKEAGFPQTIRNGSWFYIDEYKPPVCLTDIHFLDRQSKTVNDPFCQNVRKYERWTMLVPTDYEARVVSSDEQVPLSVQAMQQVTFTRLKSLNACQMPTFTELFEELPKALHEHWTKQLFSYEGPFNLRVEWDESSKHFWAGYTRFMGIIRGTQKRVELGRPGTTPEEALARLWLFLNDLHPNWLKKPDSSL